MRSIALATPFSWAIADATCLARARRRLAGGEKFGEARIGRKFGLPRRPPVTGDRVTFRPVARLRHQRRRDAANNGITVPLSSARRLLPRGAGAIISCGIKGGRAAGRKFIEALRLASHLANVGDAKTLVIHPASTTHQQMDAAQLEAAGLGEELVRLAIGLEAAGDIVDDLAQALRASQRA